MRVLLTSIALAGLLCAAPANAQSIDDGYAVTIPFADLNMNSAAGLATLMGRVKAGADKLCVGGDDPALPQVIQVKKCRNYFFRSAQHQLDQGTNPARGLRIVAR